MTAKLILLVEDNASDEKLALLAFKRSGVPCEMLDPKGRRPR